MKNATHYFLSALLCFFIITAKSQKAFYIGAKAGISIPNLSGGNDHINPLQNGYKTSLRGDYGILAEYQFNKRWSIQSGIDYLQEGGKNVGLQAFINPYTDLADQPYLYANYKSEVKLDYLMIPVMAKINFDIAPKWKFYINAGGFGAFALSAKSITGGSSHVYLDAAGEHEQEAFPDAVFSFEYNEDVTDSIKTFNAGAIIAFGFSYDIGRGKIFIEGGGNYGFINLQKNEYDETNHAGALAIQVGYAYNIKRKKK